MENINTKEEWDKLHSKSHGTLNYPEKFKFISREHLNFKEDVSILDIGSGKTWGEIPFLFGIGYKL
jgi:hypothetical protein